MSFAGAVFDLDGTLVDTSADITASVNHTRAAFRLAPVPASEAMRHIGDGLEMLLRRTVSEREAEVARAVGVYRAHHAEHFTDHTALYAGVGDSLARLAEAGVRMAVISNKPTRFARALLEHLGVARFFTHVLGADAQPRRKPAPDALLLVLAAWGMQPAAAVMVGDGHQDMESGRAAGCATVWVSYGFGAPGALAPDFTAASFGEAVEVVLGR